MNQFRQQIEEATGTKFRPGNHFKVLSNGDEIFPAMLEAISSAQYTIEFSTYVFWRSKIAAKFANALCARARNGVEVRVLIDAVGGAIMDSRMLWQFEQAGVKFAWFRPVLWPHLRRLNNRTHRKILLVDDQVGFTGGVGIATEWTGHAQDRRHWREIHCRVEGPACADLLTGFAESWLESTQENLERPPAPLPAGGGIAVHTTISTAGTARPTAVEQLFSTAIDAARNRLWITTAYFVPNEDYVAALIAAASRGADVRILTNGSLSNHKITRRAGHASYQALLEGGVKIYEYQGTVLHSKVITADSQWATIGSTNLDDRSLILNDELNVSVLDPDIIAALDQYFLTDLERSVQIAPATWRHRAWLDRLAEAGSSVFRRQL